MKKKGFTLIELLVVITIVAILAGIAIPVINAIAHRQPQVQEVKGSCVGTITLITENDRGGWVAAVVPSSGQGLEIFIPPNRTDLMEVLKSSMRDGKRVQLNYTANQNGYTGNSSENLN